MRIIPRSLCARREGVARAARDKVASLHFHLPPPRCLSSFSPRAAAGIMSSPRLSKVSRLRLFSRAPLQSTIRKNSLICVIPPVIRPNWQWVRSWRFNFFFVFFCPPRPTVFLPREGISGQGSRPEELALISPRDGLPALGRALIRFCGVVAPDLIVRLVIWNDRGN